MDYDLKTYLFIVKKTPITEAAKVTADFLKSGILDRKKNAATEKSATTAISPIKRDKRMKARTKYR